MKTYLFYGQSSLKVEGSAKPLEVTLVVSPNGNIAGFEILDCGSVTNAFVTEILVGKFIDRDMNLIIQEIRDRVRTLPAKTALIEAIQGAREGYLACKDEIYTQSKTENAVQKMAHEKKWDSLGDDKTI